MLILHDLVLGYDGHPVLRDLNLQIADGSLIAIVGPNGAGKSTLLRALAGQSRLLSGRIQRSSTSVAWLPQQSAVDTAFPIDVRTFVSFGLWAKMGALGVFTHARRQRVAAALELVHIEDVADRPIGALSGGQLRRAMFARLWLQDAALVVLDEPFASVDAATENRLMAVIAQWHAQGRTVLVALHDLQKVRRHFPETLLIAGGSIAHGTTDQVLTPQHLGRAGITPEWLSV